MLDISLIGHMIQSDAVAKRTFDDRALHPFCIIDGACSYYAFALLLSLYLVCLLYMHALGFQALHC